MKYYVVDDTKDGRILEVTADIAGAMRVATDRVATHVYDEQEMGENPALRALLSEQRSDDPTLSHYKPRDD